MRKFIPVLIVFILLCSACSPRPLVSSIDLSDVGPRSRVELASSKDLVITPGTAPDPVCDPSSTSTLHQITATVEEVTQKEVDPLSGVQFFTSQLQSTQIRLRNAPTVEQKTNNLLKDMSQMDAEQAEAVFQSARTEFELADAKDGFYAYSYSTSQTITRLDSTIFSVVTYTSGYTGGANSSSKQYATNIDLSTGNLLSLADVLVDEQRSAVYDRIIKWLESVTEDYQLFPVEQCKLIAEQKFGPESMSAQYTDWYLTNTGLMIFFNPQEVSPATSGIIQMELSYASLARAVASQYTPNVIRDQPLGSFSTFYNTELPQPATQCETISLSEGDDQLILWVTEPIFDVSLTNVSWIGDQSVDIRTLYRANLLVPGHMIVIELDGGYDLSTLCFRLNPGDGLERTVYFEPETAPGIYNYSFTGG